MSQAPEQSSENRLLTQIQFLKGVGPRRAATLQKLGLHYAKDLLFFFPRSYEALSPACEIRDLINGQSATVVGEVTEVSSRDAMSGATIVGALIEQPGGALRLTWFNQPFMRRRLAEGMRLMVSGVPKLRGLTWEMIHPQVTELKSDESIPAGQLMPVYRLTQGIRQPLIRRIVQSAANELSTLIDEVLPESFREQNRLVPIADAIRHIHNPPDQVGLDAARRRFVYQEFLVLQLALALRRKSQRQLRSAAPLPVDARLHARIQSRFPFDLTPGQNRAIADIRRDMAESIPMNRMIQGDVGSGKTIVAIYAMMAAVAHEKQAALMAPTEILARQHFLQLEKLLEHSRIRIGLLTGGLTAAERKKLTDAIRAGEIDMVVGTHAVIHNEAMFQDLAVVVVDEQHKFGVRQRQMLKESGSQPHTLVMTATPIPRTLCMTLFGDLDVSTIDDLPPGRKAVHTYVGADHDREKWWQFFRKKLNEGRQGYVVAPLVEETSEGDLASVASTFEELANGELADFRVDLLHGRMPADIKQEVMYRFSTGETHVIVATSVIEVGIDIANATIMTIEGGERFGLSQLHQLRGRVSRGRFDGFVCVFPGTDMEDAIERLDRFAKTSNGFELAQIDYQTRGPGHLLGTKQHGLPPYFLADPFRDEDCLVEARNEASRLVECAEYEGESFARLRKMVRSRYGDVLSLGDVG